LREDLDMFKMRSLIPLRIKLLSFLSLPKWNQFVVGTRTKYKGASSVELLLPLWV
jgi:hypothetical protein